MDEKISSISIALTNLSLFVWLISLASPAFVIEYSADFWIGGMVLLTGLILGWAVNGWAAYANLFFIYALCQMYLAKQPGKSVGLMLILAATLPLFSGVPANEGSDHALPVVSWGWGAVLWTSSIILLAMAAAVRAKVLGSLGISIVAFGIVAAIVSIYSIRTNQLAKANEQERKIYLGRGVAFTLAKFCGIPFIWPKAAAIPPNEVIALDIDSKPKSFSNGEPYLALPDIGSHEENGFDWIVYRNVTSALDTIKVRRSAQPKRFVLEAKSSNEGAVIRLIDKKSSQILYEQPLRILERQNGLKTYCPASSRFGWNGLKEGYDNAISRLLGLDTKQKYSNPRLHYEAARTRCDPGVEGVDGVERLRDWDDKQVILPHSAYERIGFCSENYIGLVYTETISKDSPSNLSSSVQLFDRKSLMPLGNFNEGLKCLDRTQCTQVPSTVLRGFRTAGDSVIVETTHGEFSTQRIAE